MSFRTRLTLFFVLIVIVPMVSLTFVLFRLIADSENGKADAGAAARQQTAIGLVGQARSAAARGASAVGRDPVLATALQQGRSAEAGRRAQALLVPLGLKRIVIGPAGAAPTVDVGSRSAIFPVRRRLQDARGRSFGLMQVSAQGPKAYAEAVRRLTGSNVVVRRSASVLASTNGAASGVRLPARRGEVRFGDRSYRVATFTQPSFGGAPTRVSVLTPSAPTSRDIRRSRLVAAAILLGFFVLAFTFALLVSRALQQQIGGFLRAARRVGEGDFSAKVPTSGRDEFAALGEEFNRMSAELEQRLRDLGAEQARLAGAMQRIGETFAANLDRDGLLEIVLRSAVDGAGATAGRAGLRTSPDDPLRVVVAEGRLDDLEGIVARAERQALERGEAVEVADATGVALAHPLRTAAETQEVTGVVSVAREGAAFGAAERELFDYLVQQASVSIDNVELHETVERQAVTDELTGLANRRRFQETLAREVERSKRFSSPVALVMLDIDDFKAVNDAHGHQVGDLVLREVGRIVRESSREIDTPARYGGEELAMILPGTDLEGAFNLAERVRTEVSELALPLDDGAELRVTASLGAATLPGSAGDERELVRAADSALYDAKRAGKDRTVRAARVPLA